jgi:predicted NBD/HSP70 family sugar kinase
MQPCPAIHVELKRRWEKNMPNSKKKGSLNYMGVDIGKRNCVVCIMDSDGSIIEETKYNNTLDQAESFASSIKRRESLLSQQYVNLRVTFG